MVVVNTLHIWSVFVRFCSNFERKKRIRSIDADGSLESGESEALSPERSDKAGLQGVSTPCQQSGFDIAADLLIKLSFVRVEREVYADSVREEEGGEKEEQTAVIVGL